jgi:hypothetical protein
MNRQLHLALSEIAAAQNLSSTDINERLIDLLGQHAAVVNQLRRLQVEVISDEQNTARANWHVLENEVARLRFEMENLKKSFTPSRTSAEEIFFDEFLKA